MLGLLFTSWQKINPSCIQDHFPRSEDSTCQTASKQNTILSVIELFHILALWLQISVMLTFISIISVTIVIVSTPVVSSLESYNSHWIGPLQFHSPNAIQSDQSIVQIWLHHFYTYNLSTVFYHWQDWKTKGPHMAKKSLHDWMPCYLFSFIWCLIASHITLPRICHVILCLHTSETMLCPPTFPWLRAFSDHQSPFSHLYVRQKVLGNQHLRGENFNQWLTEAGA